MSVGLTPNSSPSSSKTSQCPGASSGAEKCPISGAEREQIEQQKRKKPLFSVDNAEKVDGVYPDDAIIGSIEMSESWERTTSYIAFLAVNSMFLLLFLLPGFAVLLGVFV